ncbi:MAG TPA: hypothetical protein HA348_07795 [Thermoplasmata archaeon]|nr:hypothetical protein [Thermoplasmata archaeon]
MSEFIKMELPLPFKAAQPYMESIRKEIKKPKFELYAIMGIDEAVDLGILDKSLYLECRDRIERAWTGESIKAQGLKQTELLEQTKCLRDLYDEGHEMALPLFERWKEGLSLGYEDASRKRKILRKKELDDLNARLGENLVATTLYLGFPEFGKENLDLIAKEWAPYAKLADNLSDMGEDIWRAGFINVPEEEIENLKGLELEKNEVKKVNPVGLAIKRDYLLEKEKEVKRGFKRAEGLFMEINQRMGRVDKERSALFMNHNQSWLLEIKRAFKL